MNIDKIQALIQKALDFHQQGNLVQAERCYHSILDIAPDDAEALHLLGVIAQQRGKPAESIALIQAAIAQDPTNAIYLLNLGNGFQELDQFDDAIMCYQQALSFAPDMVESHNGLGSALLGKSCFEQAIVAFSHALILKPDYPAGHLNLAIAYWKQGELQHALTLLDTFLQKEPDFPNGWNTLGLIYQSQGGIDKAIVCYKKALFYDAGFSLAQVNLGIAYKLIGNYEQAVACYLKALEAQPTNPEIFYNLGIVMQDWHRFEDATLCYRQALSLRPEFSEAWNNLAFSMKETGQLDESLQCFQKAILYRPNFPQAINGLLSVKLSLCDWDGLTSLIEENLSLVRSVPSARITPFSVLSIESSAEDQLLCAQQWTKNTLTNIGSITEKYEYQPLLKQGDRIKIGYLSADLHEHATAYLISELFELHNRQDFEVIVYSYGPDDGSAIRNRIASACDDFIDIRTCSDLEVVRRIRADQIDILIDLKGHTKDARDQILSYKPAPVQVSWLGYPGTMGADSIDYIIADHFIIPDCADHYYEEKVVRLPDCYQINDRKRQVADQVPTKEASGLPATGFVFCSFNQAYKIQPKVFDVWMTILKRLPGSVLWLLETNRWATENLKLEAQRRGVDANRLIFAPKLPLAEHLTRYRIADLCLDTFPVTSHTTASDALWVGCPLVTCVGETFVSRVAGSLLHNIGLPELVTDSLEAYQEQVVDLANDSVKLQEIRSKIQTNRDSYALFDSPRFVRNLERAYKMMWGNYCEGKPPNAINL